MGKTLSALILIWTFLCISPVSASETDNCSYRVGVVPQFEQRRIVTVWSAVLNVLSSETGCSYELVGSKNISDFERDFKAGFFDLAYMNPYHAIVANRSQGYLPIVRAGDKKLKGILVVKKDSPIKDVSELQGKVLAFPSPNALGASLLMRAELDKKFGVSIKPKYVKTHSSVYLFVAKGLADAGGGVMRTLNEQSDKIKDSLRILYSTTAVNSHPLVVHPRVSDDKRQLIQSAWLSAYNTHAAIFDEIPMVKPISTTYDDYIELQKLGLEEYVGN